MKKYIVIGSGILGASAAYKLAKAGADVTIIDRHHTGQATDAAAGIICPWLSQRRNKAWYQLAKGGARMYRSLIEELAEDGETETGYAQTGAISIHNDQKKLNAMKERALKRREDAPEIGDVTLLDPNETKAMFPHLDDGYGAVHISGGARVNGRGIRNSLIRGAQKHGATVINGNAELLHDGTTITGVSINDQTIECDQVIAACGVWMDELLKPLHIQFNVTPLKAQILHLKTPNTDTSDWPVVMPPNDQFMLTWDDRILVGATHEDDAGFDSRITAGGINEILSKALEIAPGLADSTILEARVGFRPHTPGFLPVIGPVSGVDGLLVANGLGSSGLTTGPFVGQQLANLALEEEVEINLSDFDVAGAIN
ncbi:FAD-binding oxidoreductase [Lentibacillus cibarius]|uniref:FAD-binding oxidoreductase n=1 Tax=Lentibacillus cibarius TaxID=2583219 RepID=A0A549YIF8_9BACI|nr:FAD-dependent oxidoreductase [Lentibacillus cibarius]TMN22878.1 FAD-binding oxidoreductase [Lentibacillus cibarius]TRM11669.1 FAD-binding oxidoreductase [Lentibacillus cibarius]